jgi:hypothetical protein
MSSEHERQDAKLSLDKRDEFKAPTIDPQENIRWKIIKIIFIIVKWIVLIFTWVVCGFTMVIQASLIFVGTSVSTDIMTQVIFYSQIIWRIFFASLIMYLEMDVNENFLKKK